MSGRKCLLKNVVTVLVGAAFFSSVGLAQENAEGGLFVEPLVTFALTKTKVDYPAPVGDSSGRADGFGLGGRLGFHINDMVFVGGDARFVLPQFKDSSVNYDAMAMGFNFAPVVGVQMPDYGVRAWGSYVFGGYLDPERSGNVDVKFDEGTGFRAGVGVRVQMVSLNLEYQQMQYGNMTLQRAGMFTPGMDTSRVNLKDTSWIASVSFPISL